MTHSSAERGFISPEQVILDCGNGARRALPGTPPDSQSNKRLQPPSTKEKFQSDERLDTFFPDGKYGPDSHLVLFVVVAVITMPLTIFGRPKCDSSTTCSPASEHWFPLEWPFSLDPGISADDCTLQLYSVSQ